MASEAFKAYTKGATEMDGRTFAKLLTDTKIVDKAFTTADVDILFAKVKQKGAKKITFDEFQGALQCIADRKKIPIDEVIQRISEGKQGPILSGTMPDQVRFHDDKSTYTGVHKAGGPTTVDEGRIQFSDLSQVCDRTAYNVRGVKQSVADRTTEQ